MIDLHQYDPVRIVWLDSFTPAEGDWVTSETLSDDVSWPLHETVGFWFGMRSGCVWIVQSRGAAEGFCRLDSPIAIPLMAVLLVEMLEVKDGNSCVLPVLRGLY